jgi:hypothetical protein
MTEANTHFLVILGRAERDPRTQKLNRGKLSWILASHFVRPRMTGRDMRVRQGVDL